MEENRKFKRVNLAEHPEVYDAHTNELLGRIVDISAGGFKMIAINKMEEGKLYVLNIVLMVRNNNKKCVEVTVSVRWCRKDIDSELITLGCHLVQIDALERLDLDSLMLNKAEPNEGVC
jgi:c-di-GMP-binding flagellar brake protein YcgR